MKIKVLIAGLILGGTTLLTGCATGSCTRGDCGGYYSTSACGRYSCTDPCLQPPVATSCNSYQTGYSCGEFCNANYRGCGNNCIVR